MVQPNPGAKRVTLDGTELVDILGLEWGTATTQDIADLVAAGATAGDLTVVGNLTVDGTTTMTGAVDTTGALTVGTDLTVTDDLVVSDDANVTGTLTAGDAVVTTSATVGTTLGVTGLATFTLMPRLAESNLAATGTVLADAAQLVAGFVTVSAADGTKGVKLPATPATGTWVAVKNNAGSGLKVYPDAAATINAIAANGPITMAANTSAIFFADAATQWWTIPLLPS